MVYKKNKLVQGWGINDADYVVKDCVAMQRWRGVLERCLSENFKSKHPTYKDCTVNEDWKYFSNFKVWFDLNYIEGYHLDKDILVIGNKEYGPLTCRFIPQYINCLFLKRQERSEQPLGVYFNRYRGKGGKPGPYPYDAKISIGGEGRSLGHFKTAQEAHKAWQLAKFNGIFEMVGRYSKEENFSVSVVDALYSRAWRILQEWAEGKETINF